MQASDRREHAVSLYLDCPALLAVNTPDQAVLWSRYRVGDLTVLRVGTKDQPVLARSGEDALALLAIERVDCILLDLMMPGLSGPETCRRIRASPAKAGGTQATTSGSSHAAATSLMPPHAE